MTCPEPPDPKQIVDDVLAGLPASVLDASEQERDRLQAARDEVIAIHAQILGRGSPVGRHARQVRGRSMSVRTKRCYDAMDRLDAYFQPLIDKVQRGDL